MKDDQELSKVVEALSDVGALTASILPVAIRLARRKARQVIPQELPGHQECMAHRLVALALMTNGLLLLQRTAEPGKVDELMDENIKFARYLISSAQAASKNEDEPGDGTWLSDDQLKKMFSEESES